MAERDDSSDSQTDRSSSHKRKFDERIEWSEDDDDAYTKFKNRATTKRKEGARARKKAKEHKKTALIGIKAAKANGEDVQKVQRNWGDDSDDYELLEESMPDFWKKRRHEFDAEVRHSHINGLALPPSYEEIYFSDDEASTSLEKRPKFPSTVQLSQANKTIQLPRSLGEIPAPIAKCLRDYQVDGVSFLHELFIYQKGGILADDMGLGKTVQVAAFLSVAFGKTGDERDRKRMRKVRGVGRWYPRILIICPGSLITNWKNELRRWGWWSIDLYHGSGKASALAAASAGRLEIVITTYTTYKNDKDKLNMVEWDCIIADECHIIKERTSGITQAMNEVNALCRIGLTGTAIQNKYEELFTLLNWTNPGRFGSHSTWKETICHPLRVGQSHDATQHQLKVARQTARKLVDNLLPQFFLRRMKSLIQDQLPRKTDRVVFCPLTEIQRDAYEIFLDSQIVDLIKSSGEPCDCGSGKKRGWCCYEHTKSGEKWQALVFPVITQLQKLSNHLALLLPSSNDHPDKQDRDLEFMKTMLPDQWQELYENRESLINLSNPSFCGKWKVLKKLLRFWHDNGDKVLVFSYNVRMLRMLRHLFQNTSYNVSYLDGQMAYEDRQNVVDEFNSDPKQFVFLISTKAGGVGLNITSANKVVIMDPNWNPSYDLQAQDRAYRIGQTRDVEVFRLISAGTVEEIVYARQIYKQQQANIAYVASMERRYFKGVQNMVGQKGEIFGLSNLLSFRPDEVILRDIVNSTNVAEAKAGVAMIGVEMDDVLDGDDPLPTDDSDNGVMSQVAALLDDPDNKLIKKNAPKSDAVQAILASVGVQYTHDNSEVIGSSKIEKHLSRRAQQTGNDASVGEERLFADYGGGVGGDADVRYEYNPPEDVRIRQFCSMAQSFGFDSVLDFACFVEGLTPEQRRNTLWTFYRKRKEALLDMDAVGSASPVKTTPVSDQGYVSVYEKAVKANDADDIVAKGWGACAQVTAGTEKMLGQADGDDLDCYDLDA